MPAEIVTIDRQDQGKTFSRCKKVVRAGGIIAYPTDTFYGLGADPRNEAAVKRLFSIKGRKSDQPILLLLPDARAVLEWSVSVSPAAERLMERFWPGPLTLVFTARSSVLPALTAKSGKIGLRVPGNEITRSLLVFLGGALTGTSANPAGGANPRNAGDVARDLGDLVDLVLDGGPAAGEMPSTVVDVTGDLPTVLRKGAISEATLFA